MTDLSITLHFDVDHDVEPPHIEVWAEGPGVHPDKAVVLGYLNRDGSFDEADPEDRFDKKWIKDQIPVRAKEAAWGKSWRSFVQKRFDNPLAWERFAGG